MGLLIGKEKHTGTLQRLFGEKRGELSPSERETQHWIQLVNKKLSEPGVTIPRFWTNDALFHPVDYITIVNSDSSLLVFFDPSEADPQKDVRLAVIVQKDSPVRIACRKPEVAHWEVGIDPAFPYFTEAEVLHYSRRKLSSATPFDHTNHAWHGQLPAIGDVLSALQPSV